MRYVTVVYPPGDTTRMAIIGSSLNGGEASPGFRAQLEAHGFVVERRSVLRLRIACAPQAARAWSMVMRWRLVNLWRRIA